MMDDRADLGLFWQQICDVTAPARGIFPVSKSARFRPIEYGFDPAAHSVCSLGLCRPDRLGDFETELGIDLVDRQIAECREHVGSQGGIPLRTMFCGAPG